MKRHRLAVALQAHHDVEPGLAHLPQRLLRRGRRSSRRRCPGRPRSPISVDELLQAGAAALAWSSPVNSTSRIASGAPISAASIIGRKAGLARASSIIVRSTSSTAVGAELDDVLRPHSIAAWKRGEVDDAEHLGAPAAARASASAPRVQASVPSLPTSRCARLTLPSARVRPLALRMEDVEVVAADAAHHLRHSARRSRRASRSAMPRTRASELAHPRRSVRHVAHRAEACLGAVGQPGVDGEHVVDHVAVGDRARAAGVVAGHAAERACAGWSRRPGTRARAASARR